MSKQYIRECKNFTWLQDEKNFINYHSGEPDNGRLYIDDDLVSVPKLDQLIKLLGTKFIKLGYDITKRRDNCFCVIGDRRTAYQAVRFDASNYETACLRALKSIKEV
jgi:hypothetical protein